MPSAHTRAGPWDTHMCASPPSGDLVPSTTWHIEQSSQFAAFRQVTEQTYFSEGIGLPGRVLATGKAAWITDVTIDPNFARKNLGVRGAFAFPIRADGEMKAVLEFFTAAAVAPDRALLEVMAQIGRHLGRVRRANPRAGADRSPGDARRPHRAGEPAPLPRSSRACAGARRAPRLVRRPPVPGPRQVQGRQRHPRAQRRGPAPEVRLGPTGRRPCERATHWRASATRCSHWRASAATSSSCSARTSLPGTKRCGSRSESSRRYYDPSSLSARSTSSPRASASCVASGADRDAESLLRDADIGDVPGEGARPGELGDLRRGASRRERSSASRRSGRCATRWNPGSCGSTTSRSWRSTAARCKRSKRSCDGSTPSAGSSCRKSSSRSRKRAP